MKQHNKPRPEIEDAMRTLAVPEAVGHIVVHSGTLTLECLHCHETHGPQLPAEVEDYVTEARAFAIEHAKCRKVIV